MSNIDFTIFTDRNLSQYLLAGWDLEKLVNGQVTTLSSRRFHIKGVDPHKMTIKQLKEFIEDKEGIEVSKQELRKGKKILDDSATLEQCWVQNGSSLLLFVAGELPDYKPIKEEEEPSTMSTKVREANTGSKTLTIQEDPSVKSNDKPWWSGGLSGPKGRSTGEDTTKLTSKAEPSVAPSSSSSFVSSSSSSASFLSSSSMQEPSSATSTQADMRAQMLKAAEERAKQRKS